VTYLCVVTWLCLVKDHGNELELRPTTAQYTIRHKNRSSCGQHESLIVI